MSVVKQAMVDQDLCWFGTNMWAVLDSDSKTIIGVLPPDATEEKYNEVAKTNALIPVTLETGPGHIPGYYENGKFFKGRYEEK